MSFHYIGDMVATYNDVSKKSILVGWITEVVDEIIWTGDTENKQIRYKIQWADDSEDAIYLYSDNDIQHMKNFYESISKTKT
jgi:hypothetical protein